MYMTGRKRMKSKTVKIMTAFCAAALFCTGCGNKIPNMTEEQAQEIGEYAAGLLLRYDANHRSRLVDLSLYESAADQTQEAAASVPQEPEGGMPPVADTPVIAIGEGTNGASAPTSTIEQKLGLPEGLAITYQGARAADSYPDTGESDIFALDAVEGKKLLILEFLIGNQTQEDQAIDLLSMNPVFRVTVNGSYHRNALTTMLEDDLSSFMGTLAPGEEKHVVLVFDIDQDTAAEINSVKLDIKNGATTSTIQLQ